MARAVPRLNTAINTGFIKFAFFAGRASRSGIRFRSTNEAGSFDRETVTAHPAASRSSSLPGTSLAHNDLQGKAHLPAFKYGCSVASALPHSYRAQVDGLEAQLCRRRTPTETEVVRGCVDEQRVGNDGIGVVTTRTPLLEGSVAELCAGCVSSDAG